MSKKIRNRVLALVCVGAFAAGGVFFYANWVVQRPFGVVLFLVDNLTASSLTPARLYEGGAGFRLNLESFPNMALLNTSGADYAVADPTAAASAFATGRKANQHTLNVGEKTPNLFDLARQRGRAVGLVTSGSVLSPTPAAFYSKNSDPSKPSDMAMELLNSQRINVLLGGGLADFLPDFKGGQRTDGRDLILELRGKGYDVIRSKAELDITPFWQTPRTIGLFSSGAMSFVDEVDGSQPSLANMVTQAIQMLQYNAKGYVLVVDACLPGLAASQNQGERAMRELIALDQAVAAARQYAGEKTLVIVAGKTSTGGMRLNGYPLRNDKGAAILGINAQGTPSITWSTGPGAGIRQTPDGPRYDEPTSFRTAAAAEVAEDVIAVSEGPGAEKLRGFLDNTVVFDTIVLGL